MNVYQKWSTETPLDIGKRIPCWAGKETVSLRSVFAIVERMTGCYLSIRIDCKTTTGVAAAMDELKEQYGEKFSQIFRTIE